MVNFSVVFVISLLFVSNILSQEREEKFCSKSRKLLLGGVFNYDRIVFAYSWIDTRSQTTANYLVWRFEIKKNKMVPIGKEVVVGDIFPGIPLIRGGLGLTIKCDASDTTCKSYRQLVFIFFQTQFKVFRFSNDHFSAENDKSKIPWGLKIQGPNNDWYFRSSKFDPSAAISAIAFMSGYQSQIFMISKDVMYVSAVDIKASALKWTQVAESQDLAGSLGGFIVGTDIFINKKMETSDSILMKYDQNGKAVEEIPVWTFFGCDPNSDMSVFIARPKSAEESAESPEEQTKKRNSLAAVIMICVVIVIVITNLFTGIFWVSIYRKNRNAAEMQ